MKITASTLALSTFSGRSLAKVGLVGLMTWLKWLYVDIRPFENRASAARRLQALVERVERWDL